MVGEVSRLVWSSRHDQDAQQQEDHCLHSWYTLSFHKWHNERETRNLSRCRRHSVQSSSHTMWDDVATTWHLGWPVVFLGKGCLHLCMCRSGWMGNTVWLQSIFWVRVCPLQCCLGMWQHLWGLTQGFPSTTLSAHFLTQHTWRHHSTTSSTDFIKCAIFAHTTDSFVASEIRTSWMKHLTTVHHWCTYVHECTISFEIQLRRWRCCRGL